MSELWKASETLSRSAIIKPATSQLQHAQLVLMYCISVPNLIALQHFLQHLLAAARSSTLSLVLNGKKNWQHAEVPHNTQFS